MVCFRKNRKEVWGVISEGDSPKRVKGILGTKGGSPTAVKKYLECERSEPQEKRTGFGREKLNFPFFLSSIVSSPSPSTQYRVAKRSGMGCGDGEYHPSASPQFNINRKRTELRGKTKFFRTTKNEVLSVLFLFIYLAAKTALVTMYNSTGYELKNYGKSCINATPKTALMQLFIAFFQFSIFYFYTFVSIIL